MTMLKTVDKEMTSVVYLIPSLLHVRRNDPMQCPQVRRSSSLTFEADVDLTRVVLVLE